MFSVSAKSKSNYELPHQAGAYDSLMHRVNGVRLSASDPARFTDLKLMTDKSGLALGGSVLDNGVRRELQEHEIIAIASAHIEAVYAAKNDHAAKPVPQPPQPATAAKPSVEMKQKRAPRSPVQAAIDAYCTRMGATDARSPEYGTEVEIQALAEALKLEVTVLVQGMGSERDPSQGPGVPMPTRTYRPANYQGPCRKVALLLEDHGYRARNSSHFRPLILTTEELERIETFDLPTMRAHVGHAHGDGNCLFWALGDVLGKTPSTLRSLAVSWLRLFAARSEVIEVDVEAQQLRVKPCDLLATTTPRAHL